MLALALTMLIVFAGGAIVWAHDHHVPRAHLEVNGEEARLGPWSIEWVSGNGTSCAAMSVDGIPNFRPIVEVDHSHVGLKVVFHKEERPRAVAAYVDDRLENGYLANGRRVPVDLHARRSDGRRFWVAQMHVTLHRRLFFDVNGRWRDEQGCGGREDANWSFRLRRV